MHRYTRFAISCVPEPGSDLAVLGKHWLGWDVDTGTETALLKIDKLPRSALALTGRVRRYGFQAPLMAPFRLARGHSPLDLHHSARALAEHFSPIQVEALRMARRRTGLCLVPLDDTEALQRLATTVQGVFEEFSEPNTQAKGLGQTASPKVIPHPSVLNRPFEFQFRITNAVPAAEMAAVFAILRPIMEPNLPRPFVIRSLSLLGEDPNGWFRLVQRYPLGGQAGGYGTGYGMAPRLTSVPRTW